MAQASSRVVHEAAAWAAELDAGALSPGLQSELDAWRSRDPNHARTLDRMLGLDARLTRLDRPAGRALRQVLRRVAPRRKGAALLCVAGALAVLSGGMASRGFAVQSWFPGQTTATGEQRHVELADGSRLDLDTATAASVSGRRVRLFRGQVLATVAKADRPFVVETRHGRATALGTAYVVRTDAAGMQVAVVESRVEVCPRAGDACLVLRPGERAEVRDGRVRRLAAVSPERAAAWASGWLEADDLPVAEALAELRRYRAGAIDFDAASLAGVRVTGSFPLTQPERALRALADAGRLRVQDMGDGAVRVSRAR